MWTLCGPGPIIDENSRPPSRREELAGSAPIVNAMFENLMGPVALLAGVLLIGAVAVSVIRRRMVETPATDYDLLSEFQAAYDAGEIDEEEYRRVRDSLDKGKGGKFAEGVASKADRPSPRPGRSEEAPKPEDPPTDLPVN
jgi:hypothetical protein